MSVVENIPSAVNKGLEFDFLFLATNNFTIGANGSYTDSTYNAPYTFFNEADPRYPRDVFGGDLQENPCNAAPELKELYCLEVNGYELQGIPQEKFTVWGNYADALTFKGAKCSEGRSNWGCRLCLGSPFLDQFKDAVFTEYY